MIYGDSIRLRAIERDDIPMFVRWFNDPEVRNFLLLFEPMSRAKEEQWFDKQLETSGEYIFVVELSEDAKWIPIGNVGLHRINWQHRFATFGIVIGEKQYWSMGLGKKATRALLRFAFDTLNLNRVQLEVYETNPRAIHCYEQVGFVREGVQRKSYFLQGEYHDMVLMGILRDEYSA